MIAYEERIGDYQHCIRSRSCQAKQGFLQIYRVMGFGDDDSYT